ncbi:MAG: MAPEG family protein [Rhodospirillaceae bacterium]|nr:MAPEG family protein [Rhodospirillaceae bacterium]
MVSLSITPIYAAIFALILVGLSSYVIKMRYKHRVSLGDGGNKEMLKAIRAHGNFIEYVPMSLILLAMLELGGENPAVLHTFGVALLVGRALHAPGLNFKGTTKLRQIGMVLTFGVLIGLALRIIALAF